MSESVTVFSIGEQEYNVVKKGVAQAEQVVELGAWLAKYGTQAYRAINDSDNEAAGIEVIGVVLQQFDADALVQLFALLFGCGLEVSREEFDIALLIDGCFALYENSAAIKRVVARFFSSNNSTATPTDSPTQ